MKTAVIICEYNPFHNGHKYHIEQTKRLTGAQGIIAVMSGNFVQRGGCAIADKYTRAKAALLGGADLVIELPVYYAASVAPLFAYGAVKTADALGIADFLSFGTEADSIDELTFAAEKLAHESDLIDAETAKYANNLTGYPAARQAALSALYNISPALMQTPNNMLAIEYLRALMSINSSIVPIGIKRCGAQYHDSNICGEYASAGAVRTVISHNGAISSAVPGNVLSVYDAAKKCGKFPVFDKNFDKSIISYLRRCDISSLSGILDMPQGFENRIISMAKKARTIDELTEMCCVRQYTRARIRRLIYASYIGIRAMGYDKKPSYVRVLGMNSVGKQLLCAINKNCSLPVITKTADYAKKDRDELFMLDITASDLYTAAYDTADIRGGAVDFTTSPIVID